jgi:hypothetical protein
MMATAKRNRSVYVIIRDVATDEIRISPVVAGYRPPADSAYRCHGPFKSKAAAERAIREKSSAVREVLYGDGKQYVK